MSVEQLKLSNQLCFPFYAVSRLITRAYQPSLDKLGITYPQYLVLLVLWEKDQQHVNDIAEKLILNTNTITPLLKRMEAMQLLKRTPGTDDKRKISISLTQKGWNLKDEAASIPTDMLQKILPQPTEQELNELLELKLTLNNLIVKLKQCEIETTEKV